MKHVETSSTWTDVILSLMAAGVDRALAVGIVDILAEASPTDSEMHHTPLILSKAQRGKVPKRPSKEWDDIAQILPRLFLTTQELIFAPDLKQKHEIHQYCRYAALTGGESGTG